ncbi:hypothetical protein BGZ95_007458, partial [Linnemannia exigua]
VDAHKKVYGAAIFGIGHAVGDGHQKGFDLGWRVVCRHAQEDILQRGRQSRSELYDGPPDHSGSEHLLVLFSQHGRGLVWDWVKEKQITQQHKPIDDRGRPKGTQTVGGNAAITAGITASTQSTVTNPACGAGATGAPTPTPPSLLLGRSGQLCSGGLFPQ